MQSKMHVPPVDAIPLRPTSDSAADLASVPQTGESGTMKKKTDRYGAAGRIEWGTESWKMAKQDSLPCYLDRSDGMDKYLTWKGQIVDAVDSVGGYEPGALGP